MEALTEKLLNDFQRGFPLTSRPFSRLARTLNTSTEKVLDKLRDLQASGAVSRVGAVFRPNTVGVSTLAAMAIPAEKLDSIAAIVSAFPQVNHNYEREHRYNLWFVVTARNTNALSETLRQIHLESGYRALILPLIRDYHIDLGFPMKLGEHTEPPLSGADEPVVTLDHLQNTARTGHAEDLIALIQDGLPLVSRPYQQIAEQLGCTEQQVIDRLQEMIDAGVIKRLGVVVRHHRLGYRANAMVVWDVADNRVDQLGRQLGRQDRVTLCYQRPRHMPDWPYNLFCMVHGQNRDEVLSYIEQVVERLALGDVNYSVLFSRRCFKQRGACYRTRH